MAEHTSDDAAHVLEILSGLEDEDTRSSITGRIKELERRAEIAERVCRAAVEVTTPQAKGESFQRRQTRFLKALAEWRATQL